MLDGKPDFLNPASQRKMALSRWENASRDIPPVVDRVVRLLVVNTPLVSQAYPLFVFAT